jgi:hypothetical protein
MKLARVTVMATSQGLNLGFQIGSSAKWADGPPAGAGGFGGAVVVAMLNDQVD